MKFAALNRMWSWKRVRLVALGLTMLGMAGMAWHWSCRRLPVVETEVFQGVFYGCREVPSDTEGSGLCHWARIDLSAPGVELYVTPLDPLAVSRGWQYRLQTTQQVVDREGLAIAVNACLFQSQSWWVPLPGDFARSVETAIADREINHVWEHTYLLWFDADRKGQLEDTKPPADSVLKTARWAVGGQGVGLKNGSIRVGADSGTVDARTAVGIDSDRNLLFLLVMERATPRFAMEQLVELGARDGMLLDGGDSTAMVLGNGATGVRVGRLLGGWRPAVATHFGVKARPLGARATAPLK